MAKLVKQCCVCGRIYGSETIKGPDDYEKISHGYCSNACAMRDEYQVLAWDENLNIFKLDVAYIADSILYLNGKRIPNYLIREDGNVVQINERDGFLNADCLWVGNDNNEATKLAKLHGGKEAVIILT